MRIRWDESLCRWPHGLWEELADLGPSSVPHSLPTRIVNYWGAGMRHLTGLLCARLPQLYPQVYIHKTVPIRGKKLKIKYECVWRHSCTTTTTTPPRRRYMDKETEQLKDFCSVLSPAGQRLRSGFVGKKSYAFCPYEINFSPSSQACPGLLPE